jgi:hypothetical protein
VLEDVQDAAGMILDVHPVAHLQAVAVERDRLAVDQVRHEQRDQFLRILIGPIGVRTARDRDVDAVGRRVGEDLQVRTGLAGGVRRAGRERIALARGAVRDVTVDLVGRDLHEAKLARAGRLEQHVGPDDVGPQKGVRLEDRAIDVGLGGEVDDRLDTGTERLLDSPRVTDIAVHEPVARVVGAVFEVGEVAGIGQRIEVDDAQPRPLAQ